EARSQAPAKLFTGIDLSGCASSEEAFEEVATLRRHGNGGRGDMGRHLDVDHPRFDGLDQVGQGGRSPWRARVRFARWGSFHRLRARTRLRARRCALVDYCWRGGVAPRPATDAESNGCDGEDQPGAMG